MSMFPPSFALQGDHLVITSLTTSVNNSSLYHVRSLQSDHNLQNNKDAVRHWLERLSYSSGDDCTRLSAAVAHRVSMAVSSDSARPRKKLMPQLRRRLTVPSRSISASSSLQFKSNGNRSLKARALVAGLHSLSLCYCTHCFSQCCV